jgi:O-antigen/teichoic acid export membrane protein
MLLATTVSGALMSMVHNSAGRIARDHSDQYGLFTTMLDTLLLLSIPAGGVQGVFAQMTASAVTEASRRDLRAAVGGVLRAGLWLGVLLAAALWLGQGTLMRLWKADGPAILWVTLGTAWISLGYPVFAGVLQGRQSFFWLGHASMAAGLGRLVAVTALVVGAGALATGAMVGVLLGALVATGVAVWAARDLLAPGPVGRFDLRSWLGRLLPVTLGLAAGSVMLSFDTPFVRGTLAQEHLGAMDLYAAAGRIGRALVMFTMPMALVLFPRVARSAATGEETGALKLALGATLGTGVLAALACTLLPELPLRILYAGQPGYLRAAPLIPWFAWAMLPLTAAYTLVNNLIARARFDSVPWLIAVAMGYVVTLLALRDRWAGMGPFDTFRNVLLTLGLFSVLLLAVAVWFTVRKPKPPAHPLGRG